ncbi:ATP-binding protein [Kribbella sp. NPDC051770]|uniref:ATP-binding protein n=1 Tax=Kribbella sp. NPDC051770 TaxID=3155413 RepID=UPI0034181CB1
MNGSDVVETINLAPDAGLVKSLGANHTLESAIADLVDNSLDAGATKVAVRLLTDSERLVQVEVFDNGTGMDSAGVDKAMTLGHQREYSDNDLGHFGIGMKAASFGHADVLTVWSSRYGAVPVGRRIRRSDFSKDFSCEVLSDDAASNAEVQRKRVIGADRGTSVVWSELRGAYRGANTTEARTWIANAERSLRSHLGVTFHRLITKNALDLEIVVDELEYADEAIGTPVEAIDPFGYASSGHPDYPKAVVAESGGRQVVLQCHIWPPKVDITGFRMSGKPGNQFQGFYIYRNDRLLQVGGWAEVANPSIQRQLARVVLDDETAIGSFLTMNPEKAGLRFEPIFRDALDHAAAADGTTFDTFLKDAETRYVEGNRRISRRRPVITPDKGFAPKLRRSIERELPLIHTDALNLQWKRLPDDEFIEVDFGNSTLWINSRYRYLFAPERGSLNDAPVVKALLFLLAHTVFEGAHLGPKDKDNIALWRAILGAAVKAEEEMRGE